MSVSEVKAARKNAGSAIVNSDWSDLIVNFYDPLTASTNDLGSKIDALPDDLTDVKSDRTAARTAKIAYTTKLAQLATKKNAGQTVTNPDWTDLIVNFYDPLTASTNALGAEIDGLSDDPTTPVITSNGGGATASINITDAATSVTTVAATGTAPITYSISGGTDAALFTMTAGVLTLLTAESVGSYQVIVAATNAAGSDHQTITVNVSSASVGWQRLKEGTGGIITNIDQASDGTLAITTDSFGAYVFNSALDRFVQLYNSNTMPGTSPHSGGGAEDIRFDPSDSNKLWMLALGNLYKSTDKGSTFAATDYPHQSVIASEGSPTKAFGPYIAVDPHNSSVVYASSTSNGLFRTINGSNFSVVSAVGTALPGNINNTPTPPVSGIGGGHITCFDPSGGTTTVAGQTRTKNIFVHTYGTGVYRSTDGGVSWTLLNSANMPTCIRRMACDPFGVLWCADDMYGYPDGNAIKWDNGWARLPAPYGTWASSMAVDMSSPSKGATRVCFITGGSEAVTLTTDGGSTWNKSGDSRTCVTPDGDVKWLNTYYDVQGGFFANCDATFDKDGSGKLWTGAEGVWYLTPPSSGTAITLTQHSRGIEQFIGNNIQSAPGDGGGVLIGTWDFPCFYTNTLDAYPSTIGGVIGPNQPGLLRGYSFDWVWNSPSHVVGVIQSGDSQFDYSSKSSDYGRTWTALTMPSGIDKLGGQIAAADVNTYVFLPCQNASLPKETTNGGTTWTDISIPGGTPSQYWGAIAPYATSVKAIESDKANGDIYIYNVNDGAGHAPIFKRTKSTGLWSIANANTGFSGESNFNEQLTSAGVAGHMFFTGGYGSYDPGLIPDTNKLFYFTNDGWATKQVVPNFVEVHCVGVGKTFGTYPAICAVGWYNGVFGAWECRNWNPADVSAGAWAQLGESYPMNDFQTAVRIDGDKETAGIWYLNTTASGAFVWMPA